MIVQIASFKMNGFATDTALIINGVMNSSQNQYSLYFCLFQARMSSTFLRERFIDFSGLWLNARWHPGCLLAPAVGIFESSLWPSWVAR